MGKQAGEDGQNTPWTPEFIHAISSGACAVILSIGIVIGSVDLELGIVYILILIAGITGEQVIKVNSKRRRLASSPAP